LLTSRTLESFIEVARKKNIKTASIALNLTASPISRRIKILEDWVGFKLFIRIQNDFVLTERGRAFYEDILPYHEKMAILEKTYKKRKWSNRKPDYLRVGIELLSHSMISKFMEYFRRNKEIHHVFYFECNKESALEMLLSEDIELLFSHRIISHEHISCLDIKSEPMYLLFCDELKNEICNKSINTIFIIEQRVVDQDNLNKISTYICTSFSDADILIVNNILSYIDIIESGNAVGIVNEKSPLIHKIIINPESPPSINKMKINISLNTYIYFLKENEYISQQLAAIE